MRTLGAGLLSLTVAASACSAGDEPRLREALAAARAEASRLHQEVRSVESDRSSTAAELRAARVELERLTKAERPGPGVAVSLPLLGDLRWDCDNAREFSFRFVPEATVTVRYSAGSRSTERRVHPGPGFAGPYLPPAVEQRWTIDYRHKPGLLSADIVVVPEVRQGACGIRSFTVDRRRSG